MCVDCVLEQPQVDDGGITGRTRHVIKILILTLSFTLAALVSAPPLTPPPPQCCRMAVS